MLNSIRLGKALIAALVAALLPMGVHAQTWPTQTVRFVVPTPAGSSVDIVARLVAEKLGGVIGQTVIVDNKGGAGGTIGADAVAKARDGHTFLLAYNGPITVAPSMFPKLPYNPQRDFAPVILAVTQPNVLAVRTDLKVNSVKELVALAKSRPGKIDYASVGNGSLSHLAMELLKMKSDTFLLHIPFNGGPAASLALGRGDVPCPTCSRCCATGKSSCWRCRTPSARLRCRICRRSRSRAIRGSMRRRGMASSRRPPRRRKWCCN